MRLLEHLRASGSGNDRVVIRHGIVRSAQHASSRPDPELHELAIGDDQARVLTTSCR